jgi:hypothetical protein
VVQARIFRHPRKFPNLVSVLFLHAQMRHRMFVSGKKVRILADPEKRTCTKFFGLINSVADPDHIDANPDHFVTLMRWMEPFFSNVRNYSFSHVSNFCHWSSLGSSCHHISRNSWIYLGKDCSSPVPLSPSSRTWIQKAALHIRRNDANPDPQRFVIFLLHLMSHCSEY